MPWLLNVFRRLNPRALFSLIWHLLLRVLGVQAPSLWDETTASTARYPQETLQRLRSVADPDADRVVSRIVDAAAVDAADPQEARITAGRQLLATIGASTNVVLDPANHAPGAREVITEWIASVGPVPDDLDHARLQRASAFFARNSFVIALVFGTSSLLEAYACPRGVRSLAATDNLIRETHRRLAETMQWTLIVQDHANWSSGRVMAAILKIRLMHATIRRLIYLMTQRTGTPWNDDEIGVPICGEDLLGMLMGFAATPLRDLPKLGVAVSRSDAEDHLYLWRVIGRFLGVDETLIPLSLAEAKGLVEQIKRLEQRDGPDGPQFARALMAFHLAISPGLDDFATRLIQEMVGERVCALLHIDARGLANATIPVPRPLPLIRDLALGALQAVLPGRIRTMLSLPSPGASEDRFGTCEVPGTAAAGEARAVLKRRGTCELWGKALLAPRAIKTYAYSRPNFYEIPADLAARWDRKDKNWRRGAERLASRMS